MNIINLVGKLPVHPRKKYSIRAAAFIKGMLVHHTGVGSSLQDASEELKTVESIAAYHVSTKGWPGIGYHYVIARDGTIYKTNNISTLSYHGGEGNNKAHIGICVMGDYEIQQPNDAQIVALRSLLTELKATLPGRYVKGHRDVKPTRCPGKNLYGLLI